MTERRRGKDGRLLAGDIPRSMPQSAQTMRRGPRGQFIACKMRNDSWTDERRAIFFATLSVTSNVTRSAKAAGVSSSTAYRQRDREPAFKAQWEVSLAEGYVHLELEMLHRARFGTKTTVTESDADMVTKRVVKHGYSDNIAIGMLSRHHDTVVQVRAAQAAAAASAPPPADETDEAKIERLCKLMGIE